MHPVSIWPGALLAAGCSLLMGATPVRAQVFDIEPVADVVSGTPLQIRLSNLPPGEVTLTARRLWGGGRGQTVYAASARFAVGADGRLDLARQAPLAGSYAGADLRGLFWSMAPEAGAKAEAWPDGEVHLQARVGSRVLATATLRLRSASPRLRWRDATSLPGARLAWVPTEPAGGKRPAVIALGGSEGGTAILDTAALLASHGFVVLGLPYYSPGSNAPGAPMRELPALPAAFADIPVEQLEAARAWLAKQPEVDASRIAVYGISKGAEFALMAATKMPWITAVVGIVPSDVIWEGWGPGTSPGQRSSFAWRGTPLPFVPYAGMDDELAGFGTGRPVRLRRPQDEGRRAHPERVAAARIPIEAYAGPVLVAGSRDDQVWDSGGMAEAIEHTRDAAGRETVALVFDHAGHALGGTGWEPTTGHNTGLMQRGGKPWADAHAEAEVFDRVLSFLRRHLGS